MAFTITSVAQAKDLLEKAEKRTKDAKANAEARAGMFLHTGETLLSTSVFAALNNALGKNGVLSIGGIPVDGVVGTALHVMATYGMFGKHDEHMHWIGTGALASFLYRQSASLGTKVAPKLPWRSQQQGFAESPGGAGYLYPYPPAPIVGPATAAPPPYTTSYGAPGAAPTHLGAFPGMPQGQGG